MHVEYESDSDEEDLEEYEIKRYIIIINNNVSVILHTFVVCCTLYCCRNSYYNTLILQ